MLNSNAPGDNNNGDTIKETPWACSLQVQYYMYFLVHIRHG
jgi:hypothetical protein